MGLAAGVHSAAATADYLESSITDVVSLTAWVALTPFTGWAVGIALVMTAASHLADGRSRSRWWVPGGAGSALLVLWVALAWADGLRVTAAWRSGDMADHLVSWPGESTPQGWWDGDVAPGWDLDLLSGTGPVILLLAVWAGPLALRLGAGRSPRPGPAHDLVRPPMPEAALRTEIARATSVASAVGVALCTATVYLQLSGGIFAVPALDGEPVAALLLRPAGLAVVLALATAWAAGRPGSGSAPSSPGAGVVLVLVSAVVAVAVTDGARPDLVMAVAGALGVLGAAGHGLLGHRAAALLLAPGTAPTRTPPPPAAPSRRSPRAELRRPAGKTTRPPAVDVLP